MKWHKKRFTHLWNKDTSKEERTRLMPYEMESQILHIEQVKYKAIESHNRFMRELDEWVEIIKLSLPTEGQGDE